MIYVIVIGENGWFNRAVLRVFFNSVGRKAYCDWKALKQDFF